MAARNPSGEHFQIVSGALVQRKRLAITYLGRSRNVESFREISPQRLVHYRDSWYLDSWCHRAKGLRSFAVERIEQARNLDKPAMEIPDKELDAHFATSYGIFAGAPKHTAVLRFTPERARWVAEEQWHPQQQSRYLEGGTPLPPHTLKRACIVKRLAAICGFNQRPSYFTPMEPTT